MFRPLLSPPRGDIEAPYCTKKKVDLPRQKTEKKVSQSNGVVRSTEGRGGGLIGIPFLLLGDSEGKRRVDLEASPSTRV